MLIVLRKIKNDYVYVTPEFIVKEKLCVFLINTKYMSIEAEGYSSEYEYLVRFNGDILAEIRKTSAEVISRIGINNL